MITVNTTIDAVILYCDESIANINIGNGYTIKKVALDDIPFKEKITDGKGNLTIAYLGSRIYDSEGAISFMCLHKSDTFNIPSPQFDESGRLTDKDMMCQPHLENYMDGESAYLHKVFALLHLYKAGNIGPKEVFLKHSFTAMNFFNNTQKQTLDNVERNIIDTTLFSLSNQEVSLCNNYLQRISKPEFLMLKNIVDKFIDGLEQTDVPTGFEKFTTALEMIFLETNQKHKKEVLAKRTAVLLGTDNADILSIYNTMKVFYRYRSESLHEGDGNNITLLELKELEAVARKAINKYLDICELAIQNNPSITWGTVKSTQIAEFISKVTHLISSGVLPS